MTTLRDQLDGLYQVTTSYFCAGFVIEGGQVTQCAPILRKKLSYWRTIARRVEPMKATRSPYDLNGLAEFPGD